MSIVFSETFQKKFNAKIHEQDKQEEHGEDQPDQSGEVSTLVESIDITGVSSKSQKTLKSEAVSEAAEHPEIPIIQVGLDTYCEYIDDLYAFIMKPETMRTERVKNFFDYIDVGERGDITSGLDKMIKFVLMAKCALDLLFVKKSGSEEIELKDDVLDKDFSSNDKEEIRQKILKIAKIRANDYGSFTRTFFNKSGGLSGGVLFFIQTLQTDIDNNNGDLDVLQFSIPKEVLKMNIFARKSKNLQLFNNCETLNQNSDRFYKHMPFALIRFINHYCGLFLQQAELLLHRIEHEPENYSALLADTEHLKQRIKSVNNQFRKIHNRKNEICKKIETYLATEFKIPRSTLKLGDTEKIKKKLCPRFTFNGHRCRTNIDKYRATCMKKTGGNKRKNKKRKTYKLVKGGTITGALKKVGETVALILSGSAYGIFWFLRAVAIVLIVVGSILISGASGAGSDGFTVVGIGFCIFLAGLCILFLSGCFYLLYYLLKKKETIDNLSTKKQEPILDEEYLKNFYKEIERIKKERGETSEKDPHDDIPESSNPQDYQEE